MEKTQEVQLSLLLYAYALRLSNLVRSFRNNSPCSGLVNRSATMSSVGMYLIHTSPDSTLSLMKKYLICMCLVRDDVDRPFSNNFIVNWLSWKTTAGPRSNPWLIRKLRAQMTSDKPSETPMISASHEDFATSFCFVLDT